MFEVWDNFKMKGHLAHVIHGGLALPCAAGDGTGRGLEGNNWRWQQCSAPGANGIWTDITAATAEEEVVAPC